MLSDGVMAMGVGKIWLFAMVLAVMAPGAGSAQDDEYAAIRERLEVCMICHGENGASKEPTFPILAGQHLHYLYVQLKDFKSGLRAGAEMAPMVADMAKSEMLLIAKFFSEQVWPNIGFRADAKTAGKGQTATVAGQCVQCHRGGYEGDSRIPRLAGQYPEYLEKTMLDFKSKARRNSAAKSSLMELFSARDIAAMAVYLGEM